MIQETRDGIVSVLDAIEGVTARRYLGEISDPAHPDLNQHTLPLIFVDFVGDDGDGQTRTLTFNLYFVHVAYSMNETYRHGTHNEIFTLLEAADNALRHCTCATLNPGRLRKIYDDQTAKGYLTIYSRVVTAQLIDEGVHTWLE